mgnify:CR=1 FL=1
MMRMIGRHSAAIFVAAALSAGSAAAANYGPGVTDTEIKLGSTNPFSGPASAYGTIAKAASAYFDKVNAEQGGVNGRKIDFIMRDDGYSPPKTVEQARKLVEQDQVLAMFQNLGTPTNTAIVKYLNAKKVPHLFVATGASKWDQPDKYPWTTGWQPSYQTEAKVYAKYILENLPNAKIGILYQNDDYGKDYLEGFHEGLGDKAKDLIVKSWLKSKNIDIFSPQLYTTGTETAPDFNQAHCSIGIPQHLRMKNTTRLFDERKRAAREKAHAEKERLQHERATSPEGGYPTGCTWKRLKPMRARWIPSISSEDHYPAVKEYFAQLGIQTHGYIQWGANKP